METEHRYYSDWNDRESGCSLGLCSCNMTCVWVRRPTHSTSAPTHSLYKSSVPCITHTLREPRALSVSHSSQWRLLTLFSSSLSPLSLTSSWDSALCVCVCVFSPSICFLSAVPFARSSGGWYQQSFVPSYLRDTEDWRGVARGQAHHDRRRREGVFLGGGHRSLRRGTNQTATLGGLALSFDGFRGAGAQVHRVRGEESVRLRKVSDGL